MSTFKVGEDHFLAHSAEELVRLIHTNSFTQAADDKAYMLDVSDRTTLQDGDKVRTSSPEAFVNDLIRHGYIKVVRDEKSKGEQYD